MITTNLVVKSLRKKLKLTQEEFAYVFGFHHMTISKYERDELILGHWHFVLMSKMFECEFNFNVSSYFYSHGPVECFIKLCQCCK